MSLAKGFAVRAAGVETEAVFAAEEVFKGEFIVLEGGGGEDGFWGC